MWQSNETKPGSISGLILLCDLTENFTRPSPTIYYGQQEVLMVLTCDLQLTTP